MYKRSATTFIITGSNGFIGKRLAALLDKDHNVIKVDVSGENVLKLDLLKKSDWKELDNRRHAGSRAVLVHLAFAGGAREEGHQDRNEVLAENACEFLSRNKDISIIYASTALVYGLFDRKAVTEREQVNPISEYAKVKYRIEQKIVSEHAGRSVLLRLANVYGPDSGPNTVVGKILGQIRDDKTIALLDYNSVRDFIYVGDVVKAMFNMIAYMEAYAALKDRVNAPTPFSVFNVGTGKGLSIYELASKITLTYGKPRLLPLYEQVRSIGSREYLTICPDKIKQLFKVSDLNWQTIDIEKGVL